MHHLKETLRREIINLAGTVNSWTADDRAKWDELNAQYDTFVEETLNPALDEVQTDGEAPQEGEARLTNRQRRPRFGRDGGTLDAGPLNRTAFGPGAASTLDGALVAWTKAQAGEPITADDVRACEAYGVAAQSSVFSVRLRPHGPKLYGAHIGEARNSLGSHSGTGGGYTVPQGFIPNLERTMVDFSSVLGVCEILKTSDGRDLPWPTSDDTANVGVQMGENQESTDLDPTFGQTIFRSYKYSSKLVRVPFELLRDTGVTDFAGELGRMLGERLGRIIGQRLTTGNGNAQPKGIVTAATLGKTATSATAITFDDLVDLQSSVDPAYQTGASWMMSQLIAASVRKLKDGEGNYLWQPSNVAGQPPTLLGAPVSINNNMASAATSGAKTVLYGDLSKYKARLVGEVRLIRLVERYAEFDQTGFLGFQECDGNLLVPSAVKYLVH